MARQEAKRRLEDMVIRTLMPGYTAAVQGWTVNWMAWLLEPTLPVYGYLASQTMQEKGETGTDASVEERQAASEEPEHSEAVSYTHLDVYKRQLMILQVAKPGSVSTPAGMDCEYPIDK